MTARHHTIVGTALLLITLLAASCASGSGPSEDEPFSGAIACDEQMDAALALWAERGVGVSVVDIGADRQCVAAYGLADPETGRRNTPETVFSIGSITKAVTAAAIFDLIDRDALTLDDPAGQHVAGLTGGVAETTIRDLLLHTSGVTGEHGVDHVPMAHDEAIASISGLDQSFEPGSAYQYANANYTLLALVVEAVTDEGYRRYLTERIMVDRSGAPIGGFWDGEPAPDGPRAWGHFSNGEHLSLAPQRGQALGPHWAMDGNGLVAMTPLEMAEWTWSLFNERILSPAATENLLSTSTLLPGVRELSGWADLPSSEFGERVLTTSGGGGSIGHGMNVAWLPESSRVIVVAENAADYDVGSFLGDIIDALIVGTGIPSPRLIPEADPQLLAAAAGTYAIGDGDGDELRIAEKDGGLVVTPIGIEALRALYPLPDGKAGLLSRHEQFAVDFVNGDTVEGRRERDRKEAEHGPLVSVTVLGTVFGGELTTYLDVMYERHTTTLGIALNANGGTEALGYDQWPDTWYVADGDEAFVEHLADPENVAVRLRPTRDGVALETASGTTAATRAG